MKALILAPEDRLGMQPLTDILPAPMVPVMNKPLLLRTIDYLKKNGITEIILCVRGQAEYIKNYFGDGEQFGLPFMYVDCAGGPFERGIKVFNETSIVLEPDILSNIDLQKMVRFHKSKSATVTIAASRTVHAAGQMDSSMFFPNGICTGVYILEPEILAALDHSVWKDKEALRSALEKTGRAVVYKSHDYRMDINTVEKYKQAHTDIMRGKCKLDGFYEGGDKIILGQNVRIHPTARLLGSVCIGDHVQIGAMVKVRDSVIGSDSFIGCESNILNSILWDHTTLQCNVRLTKTIVPSGVTIPVNRYYINTVVLENEQMYSENEYLL